MPRLESAIASCNAMPGLPPERPGGSFRPRRVRGVASQWALASATCTLLACGAGVARAASPPGVLVVAQVIDDIVSLDPAEGYELSSMQAFTNLYQRLVEPDPDDPQELRPILAVRWEPGPIRHSLVFELRAGVRFAGGQPLRAADVVFSLTRAVKLNRAPVFILNALGWTAENVDREVIALDSNHVEITWSSGVSAAVALDVLAAPVASVVDETTVMSHAVGGDLGNGWLRSHSAGSGPFTISRYIPHEALVLEANPACPGGAPLLHTIVIRNVPDAAVRALLVEVGDADIASNLGPDQITALRGKPEVRIAQFPSATVDYLLFNTVNPENPALRNPALWQAARWLIDYRGIAGKLLDGEFEVHQAFLAAGFPGALDTTPYHLDVGRAKAILRGAGLEHGVRFELDVFNQPPYTDIAQSLQATFALAGVQVEIRPALASAVYSRVRLRTEQAAWLYWVPDYFDANSTAGAFALNREDGTETLAWRAGWRIPALSALTETAARESDPARRIALYRQIQAQVQRSSPFVIALQADAALAIRSDVHGYRQGLDADMVYYDRVTKVSPTTGQAAQ
jgi:peptide/nickel transport system substrate-binding protein